MSFAIWGGGRENERITEPPDSDLQVLAENTRRRAWALTVLATVALWATLVHRQTLAAIAVTVTATLRISDVQYGWLSTGMAASFMIGSLPAARFTQRMGPQLTLAITVAATSLVIGLHSVVAGFVGLLLLRIAMGFAAAASMPASTQTIHRVMPFRDRARGIALLYLGSSLGSASCGPIAVVLESGVGWRWTFFVVAGIGMLWIPIWTLVSTRSQALGSYNSLGPPRDAAELQFNVSVLQLVHFPGVLRGALLVAAASPVNLVMLIWAAKYLARDHGVAPNELGYYLWLPPLLFGAGSLGFGELRARTARNRASARPPRALVALASALTMVMSSVALAPNALSAILLAAVAMAGAGGLYTLATSDMLAHIPRQAVAATTGLTTVTQSIVYIVVSPLIGKIVQELGSFAWVMVGTGLWVLPCALFWLAEASFHE